MAVLRRDTLSTRGFSRNSWPKGPVEIDWSHPLAANLIAYWAFGAQSGLTDLCGNAGTLTPSTAAKMALSSHGPAWAGSVADQYLVSAPVSSLFKRTDSASLFWAGDSSAAPTLYGGPLIGIKYANTNTSPFQSCQLEATGPSAGVSGYGFYTNNGSSNVLVATMAEVSGRHTVAATVKFGTGGTALTYRDGAAIASGGTAVTPIYSATSVLAVNGNPYAGSGVLNKTTAVAGMWGGRVLTAGEMAWLDAEPFVVLRPVVRRAYYIPPPTTTATSYGLTASPTSGTVGTPFTLSAPPNGNWPSGGAITLTLSGAAATVANGSGGTLSGTGPYTWTPTAGAAGTPTLTITPTAAGTVTITPTNTYSPALTDPSAVNYVASAVVPTISDPTLTPSSPFAVGTVVTVSGTFANGTPGGINILIDGSVVGTATVGSGTYTGTFSAPAPAGAHNVQVVETGIASPASSSTVSFTDTASALIIAPNNAAIVYSPYTWYANGSIEAVVWNCDGYFSTLFTGSTTCALTFDLTQLSTSAAPQIWWRLDSMAWTRTAIASTVTISIPTVVGVSSNSYHLIEVRVAGVDDSGNRFGATIAPRLRFTGITLDSGSTVLAPIKHNVNVLIFGDSIVEGAQAVQTLLSAAPSQHDGANSWAAYFREGLGCELGHVGWGSTGYLASHADVPTFPNHWNLLATGISRVLTPEPDMVIINHGTNDASSDITAAAVGVVNAMLTQWPHTRIILLNPIPQPTDPQPRAHPNTYLQAAARTCNDPARVTFLDTLGLYDYAKGSASPGFHPSQANVNGLLGKNLANLIRPYLAQKLIKRWNYA